MQVKSKKLNFELLQIGVFGNRLHMWNSLEELLESKYAGTVSMRYKGTAGGGFVKYEVPILEIASVQKEWVNQGANYNLITFNENAPDQKLLIQGELTRDFRGLLLTYSTEKKKMREALKIPTTVQGLSAKLILEYYLTPSSYDDMQLLLEQFPDHVTEFSTYSINLGNVPGRNTVVWEVRMY